MFPAKVRSLQTCDFRPVANSRLLYKVFAYLLLGRFAASLEICQPEEQHGFRPNRRLEEHLLTANMFLDKATQVQIPVWIVSLELSKAFDRVLAGTLGGSACTRHLGPFDLDFAKNV